MPSFAIEYKARLTEAVLDFRSAGRRERSAKRAMAPWPKVPEGMAAIKSPHSGNDNRTTRFNDGKRAATSHQELGTEAFRCAVEHPVRDGDA
ncbi:MULTISPECIES: hypothetical protein [unclassified Bradyrhizobium]|uniref:hypothetical protein n=1 Tax=unclassified Bradyrhizobium TaxID=2631580 RepID=UPI001CD4B818|nr:MULTISPECIES: hypothetical protein [unclassified Bradyrhizobium]MCA1385605.1 hypothetical protein [Bradyrhizobium sp. BRP05]MCA1394359.1 hypothetical protein [Bradyrhizobium sp. IC3123]MCA1422675.1 hypothetical protein [Bradyrhizobium sp. BRP23]MCA1429114.1 hypothetical protein [Bradyrhizobium sp. NBAIM16]MCA1471043.1 hypothetical protein [Bradyrhizobium sp. IC3195]